MIEFEVATKYFGQKAALDEISFEAMPGEVTALIGPNGAGKTTLFRCLLGLDRLDAGMALVDGKPYAQLEHPARQVGVLLDSRHGNPGRTGYQHLRAKAIATGYTKERVWQVLEQVGLASAANQRIGKYSLGMKQRLGLASALLCDPQTVILDEPLNGLDSDGIRWVRDLTRQLADSGKTVLLASHFMSEVENTADRVVVLGNGHVLADADSAELLGQLGVLVVAHETEALIRMLSLGGIDFEIGTLGITCRGVAARDVGELAAAGGLALTHLSELRETIEDAYLRILESEVEVTADA